jgi:hypothetical protein
MYLINFFLIFEIISNFAFSTRAQSQKIEEKNQLPLVLADSVEGPHLGFRGPWVDHHCSWPKDLYLLALKLPDRKQI